MLWHVEHLASLLAATKAPDIPWYNQWYWIASGTGAVIAAIIAGLFTLKKSSGSSSTSTATADNSGTAAASNSGNATATSGANSPAIHTTGDVHFHNGVSDEKLEEFIEKLSSEQKESVHAAIRGALANLAAPLPFHEAQLRERDARIQHLESQLAERQVVPVGASNIQTAAISLYNTAVYLHVDGKLQEAIGLYSGALNLDPKLAKAYTNRGAAKADLQRHTEALGDYDKALELNPKYAAAYYNRGLANTYLQRYNQARNDYERALEIDPGDAATHFNLACLAGLQDDVATAVERYRRAIELDEKYREARYFDDSDFDPIRNDPVFIAFREEFEKKE